MNPAYLQAPAFRQSNQGPLVPKSRGRRDPTARQIRQRAAAIRRTWSRRERWFRRAHGVGWGQRADTMPEPEYWVPPMVRW